MEGSQYRLSGRQQKLANLSIYKRGLVSQYRLSGRQQKCKILRPSLCRTASLNTASAVDNRNLLSFFIPGIGLSQYRLSGRQQKYKYYGRNQKNYVSIPPQRQTIEISAKNTHSRIMQNNQKIPQITQTPIFQEFSSSAIFRKSFRLVKEHNHF